MSLKSLNEKIAAAKPPDIEQTCDSKPKRRFGGAQPGAGRPSSYTPEIEEKIVQGMIEGKTLIEICSNDGMPSVSTVTRWQANDKEFAQRMLRAREAQADSMDQRILDIARKVVSGEIEPRAGAVAIAAYQWRARHLKPRVYGERAQIDVEHKGQVEHLHTLSEDRRAELIERRRAATGRKALPVIDVERLGSGPV